MDPNGAQNEPKNQQIEPQAATKNKEHANVNEGCQSGAASVTMASQGRPKCKKKQKSDKSNNKARKWAAKF